MAKDVTVSLNVPGGTWETLGADRARGIWPENVEVNADRWGPKTASFDLRRDPDIAWPDLQPFTPVDIEIDGRKRWSGRIAQTPTRDSLDSVINVQCEGWQAHLDDDMYERIYVHTNLSDYKDLRTFPTAVLGAANAYAAGQVNAEAGIGLTIPNGSILTSGCHVGVVLDLGPTSTAKRVVALWQSSNNSAQVGLYCRGADSPDSSSWAGSSYNDAFNVTNNSAASGTTTGTFATARRYVHFFIYYSGTNGAAGAEIFFKLRSIQVFADTSPADAYYDSGSQGSKLKAHQVVTDALDRATLLLSSDRTKVDTADSSWFLIPEFAPSGPRTPRQAWEAVDVFEDRTKKIDAERRPVYKARPTAAEVEVGQWSAMAFEDASAGDGGDIYNRVIISGEEPDSTPLRVYSTQGAQSGVVYAPTASPAPPNPSFDSSATGWTAASSAITRTTGTYDTAPAAGQWDSNGAGGALTTSSTLRTSLGGPLLAGFAYQVSFRWKASASSNFVFNVGLFADSTLPANPYLAQTAVFASTGTSDWQTATLTYKHGSTTPIAAPVLAFLIPTTPTAGGFLWIDTVEVRRAVPTIVDKQGFLRTKTLDIGFKLTSSAAAQIAEKWLAAHKRTPFKGRLTLQGASSVRHSLTGRPVPLDELLERTDEFLRFADRVDPDTGAQGRNGRIVEVTYKPATDEAVVTIDSSRARFEALLERLGLVVGQFRPPAG